MQPIDLDDAIAERARELAALQGDRNSLTLNVKHAIKLARAGWKPDPLMTKARKVWEDAVAVGNNEAAAQVIAEAYQNADLDEALLEMAAAEHHLRYHGERASNLKFADALRAILTKHGYPQP